MTNGEDVWNVRFNGPAARASQLAQMLTEAGAEIEWEPPYEQRSGGIVETVVVSIVARGAYDIIKGGFDKFVRHWVNSGGRRNDGLSGVQYEPLHGFGGGQPAQGLAGSGVELVGDLEQPLR
ncbi:MAG: hypothetical protein QOJ11_3094 [Frankiales bacterium]|nr:hypothetical protein [Frankiales bacterium]